MQKQKINIDSDIIDLLDTVEKKSPRLSLFLYNDDYHDMLEVAVQIMLACRKVGVVCKAEDAYRIMMDAHSKGCAVVLSGEMEILQLAQSVLTGIALSTEIRA